MQAHVKRDEIRSSSEALNQWLSIFRRGDWRRPAFYLGVPTLMALYWATMDVHMLQAEGIWPTLRFYVAHAYIPWWITCICTRLAFIVLAALRPAAPLLWALGALISCVVLIPYMGWVGIEMPGNGGAPHQPVTPAYFAMHAVRVLLVWMLINYAFDRYLNLPRYRYSASRAPLVDEHRVHAAVNATGSHTQEASAERLELPKFLEKSSKVDSMESLCSISAEEHYIRLHTSQGDELIYKRFSDAVRELEGYPGMRIHRSHWVSPYAVSGVLRDGKRMFVKLRDGQKLPVSRPYQAMVVKQQRSCKVAARH